MSLAAAASADPRTPPGPQGHLLLGSSPEFRADVLGFFERCAREHGDVAGFRLGPQACCLVNDPALIERVLVDLNDRMRKAWDLRQLRFVLGRGLLTNEGESWYRQRRLIQPAFHNHRIRAYARVVGRRAVERVRSWREGRPIDVHAEMMALTLEIVGEVLFGAELSDRVEAVGEALERVMTQFERMLRGWIPIPLAFPTPGNLAARRALGELDGIVYELIERRRAGSAGEHGTDLLGDLLAAQRDDAAGTSDQQLRDEVITLLLAGHETTAIALAWTLWLVGRHPEVEDRLTRELDLLDESATREAGALARLPYTRAVLRESMRLYPPAWGIGREPLEDVELGEWRIERGTQVFLVPWVTHRDGRFYAEPERFLPDRWAEDPTPAPPAGTLPKYAYFPFGGGPRHCIGSGFAMMEATLILAAALRTWRFRPLPDHPIEPQPAVTLRPRHGIRMIPTRRQAAARPRADA